jgi:hypothetical protein
MTGSRQRAIGAESAGDLSSASRRRDDRKPQRASDASRRRISPPLRVVEMTPRFVALLISDF